ncbi:MAG TPA: hypothetical protein VMD07_04795 [Candidatus Acidoferrales bacterium]|nr:hypothetical protein [Candidatus Acidoferrales bacterium]
MTGRYYAVPDTSYVREVPQPLQHLANGDMAKRLGGEIVFYTMEDHYTLRSMEVILGKLADKPAIDGVVFFRLAQFFDGGRLQLGLMRKILELGYSVAFARERMSIPDVATLRSMYPLMWSCAYLETRDAGRSFIKACLGQIATAPLA